MLRALPLIPGVRVRLIAIVIIALAPAIFLFLDHTARQRSELLHSAQSDTLRLARLWAHEHDQVLHDASLMVEMLVRSQGRDSGPGGCAVPLGSFNAQLFAHMPVAIISRDGAVQCSSSPAADIVRSLGSDYLDQLFMSHAVEISEFTRPHDGRAFAVAGLRGPADAQGQRWAAVAVIDLGEIQSRTHLLAENVPLQTTVIDRTGRILAQLPEREGAGAERIDSRHPLMPQLLEQPEGATEGQTIDQIDKIFGFTQLPQTGAKIIVNIDRDSVLHDFERETHDVLLLLAIISGLTICGGWAMAEYSVVRWVNRLGDIARDFGRGKFHKRANLPRSAGEFATLAKTFDEMATALALRHQELQTAHDALQARSVELRESERRFHDIADVATDLLWEQDPGGRFTFVSDHFTKMTGLPVAAVLGRLPGDRRQLQPEGEGAAQLRDAFAARQAFRDIVVLMRRTDGRAFWWRVSGKPIYDPESGEFVGFRGSGSDVTAAKQAEDELRAAKELAEAANRAKTDFLAVMSHELRTPLNAIIGFSELMSGEILGPIGIPEYRDYVADILASGQHLLALISEILDFIKAENGSLELQIEQIDAVALGRTVLRTVENAAVKAGVALSLVEAPEHAFIDGDEGRLRQVLFNLIGNAIKFTRRGGIVLLRLRVPSDGGVEIVITDTGIGIAPENLERVLQPFQQVDTSLSRGQEGLGLGLAISVRLVELHGGKLSLSSRLGKGTTVTIRLPQIAHSPDRARAQSAA